MNTKRLQDIREIRVGCLFAVVAALCLPFLTLGSFFAAIGVRGALEQAALNNATQRVEVTILSSRVEQSTDGTGGVHSIGPGSPVYTPRIEFSYPRNGEEVLSDRVRPVPFSGDQADAEGVVARYPVGARAQAWLPEGQGTVVFLEKSWTVLVYLGVSLGALAWSFCGGLLVVAGGWRRVGLSWLTAAGIGLGVLGVSLWATAHGLTVLPPENGQTWLVLMGVVTGASGMLPVLGAWQTNRIARALESLPPEDLDLQGDAEDPFDAG